MDQQILVQPKVLESTIYFSNEINPKTIQEVLDSILKIYKKDPNDEIVLHICCAGGDVSSSISFYDMIKLYNVNLTTIASGLCASSATTMFFAGKKKFASSYLTRFLFHEPFRGMSGNWNQSELIIAQNNMQESTRLMKEIIKTETGVSLEKIDTLFKDDKYTSTEDILKLGMISGVLM
jgi:ATP-dependent Clp endopeptidase proteolytic subunit ClpP